MHKLVSILRELNPDVDYESEKSLVDDGILDSISIVMLVGDLEEVFDVQITPVDIVPENFQSADAIYAMIVRLQGAM
ncbi:MAG: acyl carrier protein [Clostridia bacterium]|nr:acyl carrier protein [Clostridia bacterium]